MIKLSQTKMEKAWVTLLLSLLPIDLIPRLAANQGSKLITISLGVYEVSGDLLA